MATSSVISLDMEDNDLGEQLPPIADDSGEIEEQEAPTFRVRPTVQPGTCHAELAMSDLIDHSDTQRLRQHRCPLPFLPPQWQGQPSRRGPQGLVALRVQQLLRTYAVERHRESVLMNVRKTMQGSSWHRDAGNI